MPFLDGLWFILGSVKDIWLKFKGSFKGKAKELQIKTFLLYLKSWEAVKMLLSVHLQIQHLL